MKKTLAMLLILLLILCMFGCVSGNMQKSESNTTYKILLNSGSCFVYTFKDTETGVWYISTSEGVTPRLNVDGTLYVNNM